MKGAQGRKRWADSETSEQEQVKLVRGGSERDNRQKHRDRASGGMVEANLQLYRPCPPHEGRSAELRSAQTHTR